MTIVPKPPEGRRRWLLLALAILAGSASFLTTVQGTLALFPQFALSRLAAFGLAAAFQLGLIFIPYDLASRTHLPTKAALSGVVVLAWLFSTATSFVCLHSAFTHEQLAADQIFNASGEANRYLAGSYESTVRALHEVSAAQAELDAKRVQEIEMGGALLQATNPHLRARLREASSHALVDTSKVIQGRGLRAQLLDNLSTQLNAERVELEDSRNALSKALINLTRLRGAEPARLLEFTDIASLQIRTPLIHEILGPSSLPSLNREVFNPPQQSRLWAYSIRRLFGGDSTAIGMAIIACSLDFFVVMLSWGAGGGSRVRAPTATTLEGYFRRVYGENFAEGAKRWRQAIGGERRRFGKTWYVVRTDLLSAKADYDAEDILRRQKVLRSLDDDSGQEVPVISERSFLELSDLAVGQ